MVEFGAVHFKQKLVEKFERIEFAIALYPSCINCLCTDIQMFILSFFYKYKVCKNIELLPVVGWLVVAELCLSTDVLKALYVALYSALHLFLMFNAINNSGKIPIGEWQHTSA